MAKGRPKLSRDELMVSISIRLPKWLVERYDGHSETRSALMRRILEDHSPIDGS